MNNKILNNLDNHMISILKIFSKSIFYINLLLSLSYVCCMVLENSIAYLTQFYASSFSLFIMGLGFKVIYEVQDSSIKHTLKQNIYYFVALDIGFYILTFLSLHRVSIPVEF